MKRIRTMLLPLALLCALLLSSCQDGAFVSTSSGAATLDQIPAYSGEPYVTVNDNEPFFTEEEFTTESFETYSELDDLGRCGTAYANVGQDLMPTQERESISSVTPSGWENVEYDGQYLYNRCHLIGFQLTGENANERNLITGTRYMNVDGMLPFENMVADYVKETGNHVLYRVTPVFEGENLVAGGVLMEAESVEDSGDGVCFCVYVYNVQPGITIDYANGYSARDGEDLPEESAAPDTPAETTYILNTSSHKFHLPTCSSVADMKESNKQTYTGSREALLEEGYTPCGVCKP
ncbi:DNA/RNA non-specific endonuclease [Flavonifractor hominis]|uniref:DNA/RNA non-specific endonuclease n=1 Tax=Flavonifractor hominis TaxID=3133178 RepID=A0ABV1EP80_9FIRM